MVEIESSLSICTLHIIPGDRITIYEVHITIHEDKITIREDQITIREDQITIREDQITIREDQNTIREDQNTIHDKDSKTNSENMWCFYWAVKQLITKIYKGLNLQALKHGIFHTNLDTNSILLH